MVATRCNDDMSAARVLGIEEFRTGPAAPHHRAAGPPGRAYHWVGRARPASVESRQQVELVWVSRPRRQGRLLYSPPALGSRPW
ncbi:hypothetical protein Pma05_72720 [Plantactinospora mayteni]|uniref:Uncharacterized protein n=1 Tax=Plantactinospora mayteni TaxID=566021 RepID=A0ABQ4F1H3_9ACTN|nr:hypothetical protein Pma05_72720 [Plantactinospora mayteni]